MSLYLDIEKKLGSFDLKIKLESENECLALLGASGCGKSMTLKCIAGIVRPDRGRIVVDDTVLFDSEKHINLKPQDRRTGFLFQNYALFPNMNVRQNILCGARREKNVEKRTAQVNDLMESFGIADLANRLPSQLSGGQQQRVALARILVSSPRILLLDEPFSALDSHLRFKLEQEVKQVIRDFGKSVVLVSHDRDEVYRLSDKIAVMDQGRVEAFGNKKEIFANPCTTRGAVLTGCKNISAVAKNSDGTYTATEWGITFSLPGVHDASADHIGIRMHDLKPGGGENTVNCRVIEVMENPFSFVVTLCAENAPDGAPFGWELSKELWHSIEGETVSVSFPSESLLLLND